MLEKREDDEKKTKTEADAVAHKQLNICHSKSFMLSKDLAHN